MDQETRGMFQLILDKLESHDRQFERLNGRLDQMDSRLDQMEVRLSNLERDVAIIKEDAAITRGTVNALVEWVEEAQVQIQIPLFKKMG